jgi:hypothetical protein
MRRPLGPPKGPCLCAKWRFPKESKVRHRTKSRSTRVEMVVIWAVPRACPQCGRQVRPKGPQVSKTVQEIIFGRYSLKRRLVKYIFQTRRCSKCRMAFGVDKRFKLFRKYSLRSTLSISDRKAASPHARPSRRNVQGCKPKTSRLHLVQRHLHYIGHQRAR